MANGIYTGFWLDHSRHPVLGATLTLSVDNATYLTSFLSFIVTAIITGSMFKIVVFVLYMARPLHNDETDLIGRIYVTLRNASSPLLPPWDLLKAFLPWSKSSRPSATAHLVLVPVWILLLLKLGGAAIPPLIVSKSGSAVGLAKPGLCGLIDPFDSINLGSMSTQELHETIDARRYAAERYAKEPTRFSTDSPFPIDALPFETIKNTTCPFLERFCLLGRNSAITFDTGLLDSHAHLGINTPASDRVQYRWRSTCTVLNITANVQVFRNTTYQGLSISDQEPLFAVTLGGGENPFGLNYTFLYRRNIVDPSGYEVQSVMYSAVVDAFVNVWTPIEPLFVPDARTTLVLISPHNVVYEEMVVDPVFQATTPTEISGQWESDYAFRIMACVDQRQFCNPVNGTCTSFNATDGEWSSPFVFRGLSQQYTIARRLKEHASDLSMWSSVRSLGRDALIARSLVPRHTDKSPGLPSNQWQLEAQRWFETGLAKFQYKVLQYTNMDSVKPSIDIPFRLPEIKPSTFMNITELDDHLEDQCGRQRVRLNGRGQNVSVLGLAVLLTLAFLLYVVAEVLYLWADREPAPGPRRERWQSESTLALWEDLKLNQITTELVNIPPQASSRK